MKEMLSVSNFLLCLGLGVKKSTTIYKEPFKNSPQLQKRSDPIPPSRYK